MTKKHTGLWVPKSIVLNPAFAAAEKLLLAEIHALEGTGGCFASNAHLCAVVGVKDRQLRNYISRLHAAGLLRIENRTSTRRRLWVSQSVLDFDPSIAEAEGDQVTGEGRTAEGVPELVLVNQPASSQSTEIGVTGIPVPSSPHPSMQHSAATPGNLDSDAAVACHETWQSITTENTMRSQKENTIENTKNEWGYDLPDWMPEQLWNEWIDHNREQGRKITATAARTQLEVLYALDMKGNPLRQVVKQSIMKDWKSFYDIPEKDRPSSYVDVQGRVRERGFSVIR